MMENKKNIEQDALFILASASPRRKYLLEQAGLTFSVIPAPFDESAIPITDPFDYVRILAEGKAGVIADQYPDQWVIGADTVVVIGENILGKPNSPAQAGDMLKSLSGQVHQVMTGYCICCRDKKRLFSDTAITKVQFKDLTDKEIQWYVRTGEAFDKAGAYAIQGLGTFLVKAVNGSYTNVVGLPVCEVIEFLIREGILELE